MFASSMKFTLVFTLCALALNMLIGYYVSFKRNVRETDPIYDVGFNLLPDISRHDWLSDVALIVPLMGLAFAWPNWSHTRQQSMLVLLGIMFLFRSIVNYVTTYPSMKKCELKPPFGFCNDFMFSGHTSFNLVVAYHLGGVFWPSWPILASLLSIATHEHYSADVVMAWIVFTALKCRT